MRPPTVHAATSRTARRTRPTAIALRTPPIRGVAAHAAVGASLVCAARQPATPNPRTSVARPSFPHSASSLRPGMRGLIWGLDLGTLVSTQKSTSLIWAAVLGAALMSPTAVLLVLATSGIAYLTATAVATIVPDAGGRLVLGGLSRSWLVGPRRIAGVVITSTSDRGGIKARDPCWSDKEPPRGAWPPHLQGTGAINWLVRSDGGRPPSHNSTPPNWFRDDRGSGCRDSRLHTPGTLAWRLGAMRLLRRGGRVPTRPDQPGLWCCASRRRTLGSLDGRLTAGYRCRLPALCRPCCGVGRHCDVGRYRSKQTRARVCAHSKTRRLRQCRAFGCLSFRSLCCSWSWASSGSSP